MPPGGVTDKRVQERHALLQAVDSLATAGRQGAAAPRPCRPPRSKAYGMILGDAKKAFDLSQEKDDLRERYGRNHFGQSCLLARRLVRERRALRHHQHGRLGHAHRQFRGHEEPRAAAGQGLLGPAGGPGPAGSARTARWSSGTASSAARPRSTGAAVERRAPPLSAGLLRWWWPAAASRGGTVVGASDDKGENVKERPVYPWDLVGQHVQAAGHRSRRASCRIRRAAWPTSRRWPRARCPAAACLTEIM